LLGADCITMLKLFLFSQPKKANKLALQPPPSPIA
jgi:hypothetical protein